MLIYKCDFCGRNFDAYFNSGLYSTSLKYRPTFPKAEKEVCEELDVSNPKDPCARCQYEIGLAKEEAIRKIQEENGTLPPKKAIHEESKKKKGFFG